MSKPEPKDERVVEPGTREPPRSPTHDDWSPEKMRTAMDRIVERRKHITMTAEELNQIIEEHRREIGRGPLVNEPDQES